MLETLAVLVTPAFIGLLAWFLKRHIDQTDSAVKSAKEIATKARDLILVENPKLKSDIEIVVNKMHELNERFQYFAHSVSQNIQVTHKATEDQLDRLTHMSGDLYNQYVNLNNDVRLVTKSVAEVLTRIDNQGGSLKVAAEVMKVHHGQLKVLDEKIEKLGKIVWLKNELPKK